MPIFIQIKGDAAPLSGPGPFASVDRASFHAEHESEHKYGICRRLHLWWRGDRNDKMDQCLEEYPILSRKSSCKSTRK